MSEPNTLADNQKRAEKHLQAFTQAVVPHFIDGKGVLSLNGGTFDTVDPTTNAKQCTVASGNAADIDQAVRAAAAAFKKWRNVSGQKRRAILHAIARDPRVGG